jgi:hypothetical protein
MSWRAEVIPAVSSAPCSGDGSVAGTIVPEHAAVAAIAITGHIRPAFNPNAIVSPLPPGYFACE